MFLDLRIPKIILWGMVVMAVIKRRLEKLEDFTHRGGTKKDIAFLIISGIALLFSLLQISLFPFDTAWFAVIFCGIPILLNAVFGLILRHDIKADVLVSIALLASIAIGEMFAAGEVAFIMQLGGLLEELTVARSQAGIERLVHLTPQTATRIINGTEETIPAESVKIGDILRVRPGETVPVDGLIISGQTSVNQAVMTGESMPVDKTAGDEVSSGTVNQYGAFDMRALRVGEDSSVQRMIRLVQSADASKAKIVGLADRWAVWIIVIALSAAVITWAVTRQIIRAVTILVVFCPCSLVLATPCAIMAAIGNASRHGFLVSEGDALERLSGVKKILFDKTGTLTYGVPEVTEAVSLDPSLSSAELLAISASAEQLSEHPVGKAIVRAAKRNPALALEASENFKMIPGRGVSAKVGGQRLVAGNPEMLAENGSPLRESVLDDTKKYLAEGCTVIYIAAESNVLGYLVLSDTIREGSRQMIEAVKNQGLSPVLLTGDNQNAASAMAKNLGICDYRSQCLPKDKLDFINESQLADEPVCMIGDGINDAPALKKADVGIAMGGIGSDIAVDAADIVLVDDNIEELPHLTALSKHMMFSIKCNLTFSMTLNVIAIILAITGILNPVIGALVHNCGSVLVIINSALLLGWKAKK